MKSPHVMLLLLLVTSLVFVGANRYEVFCYWNTLSFYREGLGKFRPWNIDPKLCTHLAYVYFGIDEHGEIKIVDNYVALKMETIRQAVAQKKINPTIKVLASVGGKHDSSVRFSIMAANKRNRLKFISSILNFLQRFQLDGIDLHWVYPTLRGGQPEDRMNFILLVKELKEAFKEKQFLLTVAVAGNMRNPSAVYNIPRIAEYVDLINLKAFDFNEESNSKLLHNAPLHSSEIGSVELAAKYWITRSGNASKILLGIPFFGRTYTLASTTKNALGSESRGAGLPGKFTREPGFLGYNEICEEISSWTRIFDITSKVPYAFKHSQWISYDGPRSVSEKVKFLISHKMAGAMVWSIDLDDFSGKCGEKYRLLLTIHIEMEINKRSTRPNNMNREIDHLMDNEMCKNDGLYSISMDCTHFYKCRNGERDDYECLNGLYFDEKLGRCNLAKLVNCNQNYTLWKPGMKKYNSKNLPLNLKIILDS